ncbi:MAG TPA: pilus assembly protein TadG-related protein [Candidatus Binatia bacterium]|nr:pilus assembly protein TadG-related protein [Candidatus Binatia bacterium]
MESAKNERGSVIVFVTLAIVLLLIMVGMGLDTGHLAYIRAQGQPAVDAAALAAAAALPTGDLATVQNQAAAFNGATKNNYLDSPNNLIGPSNVTLVQYNDSTGAITTAGVTINNANGVRVALENNNPYGGTVGAPMKSPLFLTPLLNLFGQTAKTTADISVSAVAVIRGSPDLPLAIEQARCTAPNPQKLLQSDANKDNSGYTTYYIHNASATEIKGLINNPLNCNGIPPVGIGFCTELNNGQIASVYDDFEGLFTKNPGKCYMIPVVANSAKWNQCSDILDFAKFCPDPTNPVQKQGNPKYLLGTITCGQNPYNTTDSNCYVPTLVRDKKSGM